MPRSPLLCNLSSEVMIRYAFFDALNQTLGIKGEYTLENLTSDGYSDTIDFLSELSAEISQRINQVGQKLGEARFQRFDPTKTKLEPEIIDEIWLEISQLITEKIQEALEKKEVKDIPGLKEAIEESDVITKDYDWLDSEDGEPIKQELLKKLPGLNDREQLLRNFKNELFSYFQKEFGLYKEQEQEIQGETRRGRR